MVTGGHLLQNCSRQLRYYFTADSVQFVVVQRSLVDAFYKIALDDRSITLCFCWFRFQIIFERSLFTYRYENVTRYVRIIHDIYRVYNLPLRGEIDSVYNLSRCNRF